MTLTQFSGKAILIDHAIWRASRTWTRINKTWVCAGLINSLRNCCTRPYHYHVEPNSISDLSSWGGKPVRMTKGDLLGVRCNKFWSHIRNKKIRSDSRKSFLSVIRILVAASAFRDTAKIGIVSPSGSLLNERHTQSCLEFYLPLHKMKLLFAKFECRVWMGAIVLLSRVLKWSKARQNWIFSKFWALVGPS